MSLDSEFIEKIIAKSLLQNKEYLVIVSSVFEDKYFDDTSVRDLFKIASNHFKEYKEIPSRDIIINTSSDKDGMKKLLEEADSIDFDSSSSYDYLFTETNNYLKDKAIKNAILDSVDIIDKKEDISSIRKLVESAICKDLKQDIGHLYFRDMHERLKRIITDKVKRVPSYYPTIDEYISGGFPFYTLSVIMAAIHGGKSQMMVCMSARQVLNGYNVAVATCEMSEDSFSQRFDAVFSGLDINRMYISKEKRKNLFSSLEETKRKENRGEIIIKQFPTGKATVDDFRKWLRNLSMRGVDIDILYVDYLNLMKPSTGRNSDNTYTSVKSISEELRALGLEFMIPVITVTQLNREGHYIDLGDAGFGHISECISPSSLVDLFENNEYRKVRIDSLKIGDKIKGSSENVIVKNIFPLKKKKTYRIKTKSGKEIICSGDHKFPTNKGISSINSGMKVGHKLSTK